MVYSPTPPSQTRSNASYVTTHLNCPKANQTNARRHAHTRRATTPITASGATAVCANKVLYLTKTGAVKTPTGALPTPKQKPNPTLASTNKSKKASKRTSPAGPHLSPTIPARPCLNPMPMAENYPTAKSIHDHVHKSVAHSVMAYMKTGEKQPGLPEHLYPVLDQIREKLYSDGVDIDEASIKVTSITNALNIEINNEKNDTETGSKLREISNRCVALMNEIPPGEAYAIAMTTLIAQITKGGSTAEALRKSIHIIFNKELPPQEVINDCGLQEAQKVQEEVKAALIKLSRWIQDARNEEDDE